MDHQLQQLLDFGLETQRFLGGVLVLSGVGHRFPLKKQNLSAGYGAGKSLFKGMDKRRMPIL
jgi:hypothetical protein